MVGYANFFIYARVTFRRFTMSSKVIDFGTNRKCVTDFLLVRHSNRFGVIACFLCSWPHSNYTLFWGCSARSSLR